MRKTENRALAAEAAAIIAEGETDWSSARRKLMEDKGISNPGQLPDDDEIESALREHYAIFDPKGHAERLLELRKTALRVMREVSDYDPKLIRGVLNGCADKYSDIYLMLQAEDPKALEIELMDEGIDIEVFPNEKTGRSEPAEEIVFEAPLMKNGYFARNGISVWVRIRVFEGIPALKSKPKKAPDAWQIEEETAKSADIPALERIIRISEGLSDKYL